MNASPSMLKEQKMESFDSALLKLNSPPIPLNIRKSILREISSELEITRSISPLKCLLN